MKRLLVSGLFVLCSIGLYAQDSIPQKEITHNIAVNAYFDFTKQSFLPFFSLAYDYNKFSIEARYNYDITENFSLFLGAALYKNNWKFRIMQGLTFGKDNVGICISPVTVYDGDKIYFYNNPQLTINIKNVPTYFSHWAEVYYKPLDFFWLGIADRLYFDSEISDVTFGPVVSFNYRGFFINLNYWVPLKITENRVTVLLGYEMDFVRLKKVKAKN
ncbi:MAG: hypothetical protein PHR81_01375 [Bacteroidales bacterium]|jgi:hypothetical protein|nr:hypothetical protein [Bacteroidales bacterium]MDD4213439.1 hypothetical protein [Bacteroidales bacterium]